MLDSRTDDARKYGRMLQYLEAMIAAGSYPPGSQLPSLRELGETFHLTRGTVSRGLKILQARGLLEIRHGSGAYVQNSQCSRGRRRIGMVTLQRALDTQYCGYIIRGIQQQALNLDFQVQLDFLPPEEASCERCSACARDCDALILVGCYDAFLEDVPKTLPVVGINMHRNFGTVSTLDPDPVQTAELAADFFRRHGRKTVHIFHPAPGGLYDGSVFGFRGSVFADLWRWHGQIVWHANNDDGPDDPGCFSDPAAGYLWLGGHRLQLTIDLYRRKTGRWLTAERCVLGIDGKSLLFPEFHPVNTIGTDYTALGRLALEECLRRLEQPGAAPRRIYQNVFLSEISPAVHSRLEMSASVPQ